MISKAIRKFSKDLATRLDDEKHRIGEFEGIYYLDDEEEDDPALEEWKRLLTPSDEEYGNLTGSPALEPDEIPKDVMGEAAVNTYIGAQLKLKIAGEEKAGTVISRATDPSGNKVGRPHANPMFDSREFLVRFEDKSVHQFRANQIAKRHLRAGGSRGQVLSTIGRYNQPQLGR